MLPKTRNENSLICELAKKTKISNKKRNIRTHKKAHKKTPIEKYQILLKLQKKQIPKI